MGHKIGKTHRPRRGSMGFSPRVRAKRVYSRITSWPNSSDKRLLGFSAYKAGMAHVTYVDNHPYSPTKGEVISTPVTVLDVPKIKIAAIKFYHKNKFHQKECLGEVWADKLDKELARKISMPKKPKNAEETMKKFDMNSVVDVLVLAYTLPKGRAGGKKMPEIFEIGMGGKSIEEKIEYAKSILGKELSFKDVFKPGEQVDIIAVTKGKGIQGPVKRFGVKLQSHKTDTTRRAVATIGPDVPRKVSWKIAMPGQMGYHNRYDFNKWILKIGENGVEVTPKAGFLSYGLVRGEYILIKGSVPGAAKRPIRMRLAMAPTKHIPKEVPKILTISKVKV